MDARLSGHDAAAIWDTVAGMREQGVTQIDYHPVPVGGLILTPLRRKACCRACGQAMPKGADAIQFAYRWTPDYHYRITDSFLHTEPCSPAR